MTARACAVATAARPAAQLVARYRDATFTLIAALTRLMVPELCGRLDALTGSMPMPAGGDPAAWLRELAARTLPDGPPVQFDVNGRKRRRDR
jgi:hypothetical protein